MTIDGLFAALMYTYSGVIAGVDWSANDHKEAGPTKKSVAK